GGGDRDGEGKVEREIEERRDVFRRMAVIDRGIDVDGEALRLRDLDCRYGAIENALLAHRLVVVLLETVEVDREEQIGRGLEQVQLLFEQQGVGAQRYELLARDDTFDDLADLLVDQRLPALDRPHRPPPL